MGHPIFLTRRETADLLRLSPSTLANMAVRGDGPPFIKLGNRTIYERQAVLDWAMERRVEHTGQVGA